ncbi:MAG: WG repeat-containing protein, partial [Bacteroidia bacterium]|nr:WG repeat-containing protein [Bacteroidia bacterium]
MKVLVCKEKTLIELTLYNTPIYQDNQAEIYRIQSPKSYTQFCVKLYHAHQITQEKIEKLKYLCQNNPVLQIKSPCLVWMQDLVYDLQHNVNGILMPYTKGYSVAHLSEPNFSTQKINPSDISQYQKFDRNRASSFKARLTVCYHIATAIAQLHENKQYVHGNLKPEHFIFNYAGKAYLIDFDNVQVINNGKKLFSALEYSPEYLPPSYQNMDIQAVVLRPFVDVFSMAVIFYHILVGIHPFAVSRFKPPYENIKDIANAIKERLFCFGQKRTYFEEVLVEHERFTTLPQPLQALFLEVLDKENFEISAADWSNTIHSLLPSTTSDVEIQRSSAKINKINKPITVMPYFDEQGKYGFRTAEGEVVIPCKYDYAWAFNEGLSKVKLNDKYGFVNQNGVEIVPCKYNQTVTYFSEGLIAVEFNGKWGYINRQGQEVIPCKYDNIEYFREGLAVINLKDKYGYVNMQGEEVIPCKYDEASDFSEGFARVKLNGKYGYINIQGQEIVPCKYDWVYGFYKGLAKVVLNHKYGCVNTQGQEVIPCKYEKDFNFKDDLAVVWIKGKYGYVNVQGQEITPCKYDGAWDFYEGIARVKLNGKYGFINQNGVEVTPCKYEDALNSEQGLAKVKLNEKWGFINSQGQEITPCKYDWISSFNEGLAVVKKNGKMGFINLQGHEVIPCKYDGAWLLMEGLARVQLNERWGYINSQGDIV